ncbi:MAG: hypothetical protein M0Z28_18775 [Rhodospirillales bacterium]|nr:hypothetical protein [Rhodospirillales bacterium]
MSLAAAAGVARLARFRADGLDAFDASPVGLLNALAPWFAFALVGGGLSLAAGAPRAAAVDVLASVVTLLTPPVLSQGLAQLWGRAAAWLRYAVAVTWCQWVMPPALLAAVLGSGVLIAAGVPQTPAETLAGVAALGYALALQIFLARRGLALPMWRAGVVVAAVNLGTAVLAFGPLLLDGAWRGGG